MPAYKDQHWLPTAYLKYFSVDQQKCDRKSLVWRFDGKTMRCVPVESQCSSNYHYSKEKAAETEKMFQINERAYCGCVDKIRLGKELEGRNRGDLLLAMFDFHLRNAVHKNRTGKEGIEAYGRRIDIFISQMLLNKNDGPISKADIIDHIVRYWRLEIITIPSNMNNQFLTSDHPSVWTTLRQNSDTSKTTLQLVSLPLTPKHTAICFDRRVFEIIGNQTKPNDEGTLNVGQIQNAENCVYMSLPLPNHQMAIIENHFSRKQASSCEVTDQGWRLVLNYLPPEHYFSFMRLRPPLF
jgi:hypothetical protein